MYTIYWEMHACTLIYKVIFEIITKDYLITSLQQIQIDQIKNSSIGIFFFRFLIYFYFSPSPLCELVVRKTFICIYITINKKAAWPLILLKTFKQLNGSTETTYINAVTKKY